MSTEEERLAKKQAEIEKLDIECKKLAKEIYHELDLRVETDEQKVLFERYKALDRKIDRVAKRYDETSERLYEEREQVFNDLTDSLN